MRLMYLVPAMMMFTAEAAAVDGTAVAGGLGRCYGATTAIALLLKHYEWPDMDVDQEAMVAASMERVSRGTSRMAEEIGQILERAAAQNVVARADAVAFWRAERTGVINGHQIVAAAAATGSLSSHDVLSLVRGCGASMTEANAMLSEVGTHIDMALRQRGITK